MRQPSDSVPTDEDYRRLLEFRAGLRRFLRWSERAAAGAQLTPAVHQLLLAIRGDRAPEGPTVAALASHMVVRHHTAVGLIDRAEHAGLVIRLPDEDDRRVVHVRLTVEGATRLEALTAQHLDELRRMGTSLSALWLDLPADEAR
ncbi:MAG: MarR family transcriptional regulator [Dehalococcoidia bacterium]